MSLVPAERNRHTAVLTDQLSKTRDGNGNISRPHALPLWLDVCQRPQTFLPRSPQIELVLLRFGKIEVACVELLDNVPHTLDVALDICRGTRESGGKSPELATCPMLSCLSSKERT